MLIRSLFVVTVLSVAVGCKVNSNSGSKSEFYSYDFKENGCPTGTHTANSIAGICKKLEDHVLNNNCAYGLRAARFQEYNCFTVLGSKPAIVPDTAGALARDNSQSTRFSYNIDENGCATGAQVFVGKQEYCDGLMNHALNNYCALEQRQKLYVMGGCE